MFEKLLNNKIAKFQQQLSAVYGADTPEVITHVRKVNEIGKATKNMAKVDEYINSVIATV